MVGDDSGGAALVLSLADGRVHSVGMGAMTPDCFEPVAPSFAAWADAGVPLRGRLSAAQRHAEPGAAADGGA